MFKKIVSQLDKIEKDFNVKILYACESGSRAWGFESCDSDYDVRFIYVHKQEWYLNIDSETKRDVIELPINSELDISGWELRKGLNLFKKSNPALVEWLNSPIVYKKDESFTEDMQQLVPKFYSYKACFYHYTNMAKRNHREYLKKETIWIKKYFYVLRPLLAMKWIEQKRGIVPTELEKLFVTIQEHKELVDAIKSLVAQKKIGFESKYMSRIPIISDFIETALDEFSKKNVDYEETNGDIEELNRLFLKYLI